MLNDSSILSFEDPITSKPLNPFCNFFFPISYLSNYTAFQGSSAGLSSNLLNLCLAMFSFLCILLRCFAFLFCISMTLFFFSSISIWFYLKFYFFFLLWNSFLSFNSLDILQVPLRSIFIWFFSLFSCSYWLTLRWWVCLRAL